jgi:GTP cyclohydrolase I
MSDNKTEINEALELANIKVEENLTTEADINAFIKETIRAEFHIKYPDTDFDACWEKQRQINCFPALGNVYDYDKEIDKPTHYVMRLIATWHIEKALNALKFDTKNDPNLMSDIETANIGTAGRIAKIWAGNGLDAENIREYGDGRWTKPPRLATFPAKDNDKGRPVTVVIDNPGIGSVCSHHFLPFSIQNNENSRIIISYMPDKKLLGLSKIGRFVEWCLNRPSLQEEVTELIHDQIKTIAETEDVYVGLFNIVHTCEVTRGAKQYSTTTTEDYSGVFESPEMRRTTIDAIR